MPQSLKSKSAFYGNDYYYIMKNNVYLRSGDLVTISHEGSFLSVQLLTQSVPAMHLTLPNPFTSYFILSTQKCLEKSQMEQKPLVSYNEDEICYGESIILVHLLSGKYLSYNKDIESRSTLELIGTFRDCCKFTIRPIFRCQTVVTRRIRNEESVIFNPSQLYNREGSISLCIQKSDGLRPSRSHVLMKKNEHSRFLLSRKNSPELQGGRITNLSIYQLSNIQTRKNIFMSVSQTKHRDIVSYEKNINEYGSYFDLRPIETFSNQYEGDGLTHSPQQLISYETLFYIHSWSENKYLSVNMIGDICLMDSPSQDSQFYIEAYNDDELKLGSAIRIRHMNSKKYLSLSSTSTQIEMRAESRLIDTFQIVQVPIEQLRLNIFVNDAHGIILKELNEGMLNYRNKRNIQKVLKQLINFIYGEGVTLGQFLSMKTEITGKLSIVDQKLLAEVGIINTLVKLCRIFIEETTREVDKMEMEQRDNSQQRNIIQYIMMSIVGICSRNSSNTKIFVQEMPLLYQCIGSVSGIIQCFYHLFKNSKELLLILQNTTHRIEKKQYVSFELMISQISTQAFDFAMRAKIMKLMDALICVNKGSKILIHQAYLLMSMQKKSLGNVLLDLKPSDHHDLLVYIAEKRKYQQLDAMLEMKRSYEKQLMLLKEQLQLMCSMCINSTSKSFEYVSLIISEEMILRYLKTNLHPEFKQIFMRLLLDVYLSNLSLHNHSTSKSFILSTKDIGTSKRFSKVDQTNIRMKLIENEGEEMQIMNESLSHSKTIQKIQNLILQGTKKAILNEIIDSAFYMNIKALRKFLELRILDKNEVFQFRQLLVQFISRYSRQSFKEEEKKKIVLEILNIIDDYFSHELEFLTQNFVKILKIQNPAPDKLFQRFILFIQEIPFFNNLQIQGDMGFLPDLIRQSIMYQDKQIFISSSELMKKLNQRYQLFIKELKDKIILDSPWSVGLFQKVMKTKKTLRKQILEYMSYQNDKKKLDSIEQQLNQLVGQLNYFFYENFDGSSQFSTLTQNIYRQMDLLQEIVGFLNDSQKKFKEGKRGKSVDIYSTCFQFISMYLSNNQNNFLRFQQKYLDIKFVFEYPDRGQVKFLNHLIKMPRARQFMIDQIIDCLFLSFQHNSQPNPFSLLGLLNVICYPDINHTRIQQLVQHLLSNPSIFLSVLKVTEKRNYSQFMWSFNPQKSNYHKQWALYLYLLMNFLLTILQHSSQRTSISLEIKKHLGIGQILQIFQIKDLIQNMSIENLQGTLVKKQTMKIFNKIYINDIGKNSEYLQRVLALVQNTFQGLSYVKEDVMNSSTLIIEGVVNKSSDHQAIINEIEFQNNRRSAKNFELNFNHIYMSLVIYYPFLIKIIEGINHIGILGQENSTLRKEVGILQDSIYRKFKDFVQTKLSYREYSQKPKDYISAINNCEQILKRKIGFNLSIEDQDQEEQEKDVSEIQVKEIFVNRKLENIIKCYKFSSNEIERKVYSNFIYIFHSQKFKKFLKGEQSRIAVRLSQEQIIRLSELIGKFLYSRNEDSQKALEIYNFLIGFNLMECLKISFSSSRELMMNVLQNQKEDLGNYKMIKYLSITGKMFKTEIQKEYVQKQKKESSGSFKGGFLKRIAKVLINQQLLYSGNKIKEQAMIYSQRKLLSFEPEIEELTIQFCLKWIRSMALLTPQHVKTKYLQIFIQVVDLLKVYSYFITDFNSKYISHEIHQKINYCLEIIFHYIGGLSKKNPFVNYLIERQIWNDLNLYLSLDDGWARNMQQFDDKQEQTFSKAMRNQLKASSREYLMQAHQIYMGSKKFYKGLVPQSYYPLLPMKSLFGELKSNVIGILKQFKHYPTEIKQQLFSRLDNDVIKINICEIYTKHNFLFNKFDIPSVEVDINYRQNNEWAEVVENMRLENGVDLTGIKIDMEDTAGNPQLKNQYNNLRLEAISTKKIQSAFSTLFTFVRDFFLLFIACFMGICRKAKRSDKHNLTLDDKKMKEILEFFLTKLGRVEVCGPDQNQLLVVDFMVRPQCAPNKDVNKKFIQSINFVSMQLKLESIYWQSQLFLLYYQNQIKFYRAFNKVHLITFLTKNFDVITYINFAIIVAQNVVLIVNSNSTEEYFVGTSLKQPFVWLQIISTAIAGLIMIAYCIKDVPLLVQNVDFKLKKRSESYGSNFNNYNIIMKLAIKGWMILIDPTFAYHLVYSVIVGLVFFNKLFAALLLLDIFFQIPNLKNLLMSIWRPKIQLILAIVSFVLVQYFFSIFMFFNFRSRTLGHCDTLGSCFGFVFVTTYKAVGGFVGYLFLAGKGHIPTVDFFEVFQDVYVVLIYQIFFALILAIIIDTFSLIRNQQTVRQEYLDGCCIVCNLDKTRFNSAKINFRAHIAITHNIWNYFYYCEYIKHKPAVKRTPYERFIFLSTNANWLPANTSKDIDEEDMKVHY